MRATNPPQTTAEDKQRSAEWLRFQEMTEKFISDVESEGWHE
jgi:hypothetical protein